MISIGAAERVEELQERLATEFEFLRAEGIEVQLRTSRRGFLTFIGCDPVVRKTPLSADADRRLRLLVANALADLIVNRWEPALLRKVIRHNYGYFPPEEQEQIHERALRLMEGGDPGAAPVLERVRRKGRVLARLSEYLDRHSELVVDGFVTFRLKDFVEEMEEAVDLAVEEFLLDREQREFIGLLRSFVVDQEPRLPLVNLVFGTSEFRILDRDGEVVTGAPIQALGLDAATGPADDEERLVSTLLALVPRVVVVHRAERGLPAVLDTLGGVFGERLVRCGGCPLCTANSRADA